jgi:hypothetical protein
MECLFKDHRLNLATTNCISIICWPYINHILIIYRFYFDKIINYNINSKYCKKWWIHYWRIHYVHNNLFVITKEHSEFTNFCCVMKLGQFYWKPCEIHFELGHTPLLVVETWNLGNLVIVCPQLHHNGFPMDDGALVLAESHNPWK